MTQTLPITQARQDLPTLVNNAATKLAEYTITVNGSPAAVLISAAEYASWKETFDVLADPGLLRSIRRGEEDIKQGRYVTLEKLKRELKSHV